MVTDYLIITFCHLRSTQVRRNIELHSTDTGANYVTYIPKIENNAIKVIIILNLSSSSKRLYENLKRKVFLYFI